MEPLINLIKAQNGEPDAGGHHKAGGGWCFVAVCVLCAAKAPGSLAQHTQLTPSALGNRPQLEKEKELEAIQQEIKTTATKLRTDREKLYKRRCELCAAKEAAPPPLAAPHPFEQHTCNHCCCCAGRSWSAARPCPRRRSCRSGMTATVMVQLQVVAASRVCPTTTSPCCATRWAAPHSRQLQLLLRASSSSLKQQPTRHTTAHHTERCQHTAAEAQHASCSSAL